MSELSGMYSDFGYRFDCFGQKNLNLEKNKTL